MPLQFTSAPHNRQKNASLCSYLFKECFSQKLPAHSIHWLTPAGSSHFLNLWLLSGEKNVKCVNYMGPLWNKINILLGQRKGLDDQHFSMASSLILRIFYYYNFKCKINYKVSLCFEKRAHFLKLRYPLVVTDLHFKNSILKINKICEGNIYKLRSEIFITE